MKNEVLNTIAARRSCRAFQNQKPSDELISAVIEAGRHAPSGGNNQTTHFMVVENRAVIEYLAEICLNEFAAMEYDQNTYSSLKSAIVRAKKGGPFNLCYGAPVLVILANRKGYGNAMADCCCALENMAIAAESLGLGSCYINQIHWLDESEPMRQYLYTLGLLENERVCCALAMGFSAEGQKKPLERKGNPVTYIK
jgi:nitroreductase